jgi:hypothetical protein
MESSDVITNQPVVIDNVRYWIFLEYSFSKRYPFTAIQAFVVTFVGHPFSRLRLTSRFFSFSRLQGSGLIKMGFAGDQTPKVVYPSQYPSSNSI